MLKYLKSFLDLCPKGYLFLEGAGSGNINKSTLSFEDCKDVCSDDEECKVGF